MPQNKTKGHVTLIGAGPGDPELLTLKAVRALESADVVLFDALVSDEILEFIRSGAKKICVGKRGGKPSCKQDDIHDMLLRFAKAGRHVVRLKSGDPMIFGKTDPTARYIDGEGRRLSRVCMLCTAGNSVPQQPFLELSFKE